MRSPRITQRWAEFHPALAAWKREFFLIRFADASVVTEWPVLAAPGQFAVPGIGVTNVRQWSRLISCAAGLGNIRAMV